MTMSGAQMALLAAICPWYSGGTTGTAARDAAPTAGAALAYGPPDCRTLNTAGLGALWLSCMRASRWGRS